MSRRILDALVEIADQSCGTPFASGGGQKPPYQPKFGHETTIVEATAATSARDIDIDARVADISGQTITINAGAQNGIETGTRLTVYRKGKEIKDPVTNEVLDVQVTPIGTMVITNVRERVASGTYAGNAAQIGDVVRNK